MVLLYQDPKGERVGTSTFGIPTTTTQTGSGTVKSNNIMELENKVTSLEKLIAELKNENEALKVSDSIIQIPQ